MAHRPSDRIRPLTLTPHYLAHPEGSVLICLGDTKVICTASVEERLPGWLVGKGRGWVTAEYDMLPRATHGRRPRDSHRGKLNGRTQEISRLIGRALRAVTNLEALGERSIVVDCDVIQADGGTRTAAITGGYVALALALTRLHARKPFAIWPLKDEVAAISVGELASGLQLDLDYAMDSQAAVDMNVVMTGKGELVEVQGTGEQRSFARQALGAMLDLAFAALPELLAAQRAAIAAPADGEAPCAS